MKTNLNVRFPFIVAGLALTAVVAPVLFSGSFDPVAVKARTDAWPGWARVGLVAGLLVCLAAMLDAFGRLFAAVALRFRSGGHASPRTVALLRFSSLAALVGGMTLWRLLAPGMFPHPSNAWKEPCLLGAALLPVAAALRALWRAGRAVPTAGAALAVLLLAAPPTGAQEPPEGEDGASIVNAVVKIEFGKANRSFILPWVVVPDGGSGSGAVIAPGRILTCAHCVADTTFIRVRKNNEDAIYHAEPEFVDNDRDLALLAVDDPAFMDGIVPMELGETPCEQSEVLAVGFPKGGRLISFTKGIVSRIEDVEYSHGKQTMLAVQVDAAINPGNSGGPVLDMETWRIAGIAFQGRKDGEALGYIVPAEIVRCFFDDIADGRVDGIPEPLFVPDWLESDAKRRYLGMEPGQSGGLVGGVSPALGTNSLQVGDILLEIDGHRVANNTGIRIGGNRIRSRHYPFYTRQIGETVPVKVLRNGETVELEIPTGKYDTYSRRFLYDEEPDWFVFGGLVFTTLSYSYAAQADVRFHDDAGDEEKESPDDRFVMVSEILNDVSVEGYLGMSGTHVRAVDGTKVRNLRHLVDLVESCTNEFVRIAVDCGEERDFEIVLDVAQTREATPRVMKRFQIPADRSPDLRKEEETTEDAGAGA